MSRNVKIDLSLLKKMLIELELQLNSAYVIRDELNVKQSDDKFQKYIIELSKAIGIISGMAQESSLLIGDIQKLVQMSSPVPDAPNEFESILSALKNKTNKSSGN